MQGLGVCFSWYSKGLGLYAVVPLCGALAELECLLYVHMAMNMLQDSCFYSTRVAEEPVSSV